MLASAPHVKLHQLRRLDDRIAAHLDGVAVAGEFGWKLCEAALENPSKGTVFVATERAIEDKILAGLEKLLALAETVPESRGVRLGAGAVPQRHDQESARFIQRVSMSGRTFCLRDASG